MNTIFREAIIPRAAKRQEAFNRLIELKIEDEATRRFLIGTAIPACFYGEDQMFYIPKHLDRDKDPNRLIQLCDNITRFEQICNALVYFVIGTGSNSGDCLSYLFVSDNIEEWEQENLALEERYTMAWTENQDHLELSKFEPIFFDHTLFGGLERLY